jgi:hypothetical protein
MKKLNTKTIFLLCALIMGSTCVWAQTTVELTATNLELIKGGYPEGEQAITIDGITYKYHNLYKNGDDQIIAKANDSNIFNSAPFSGEIISVAITHASFDRPATIQGSTDGTEWSNVQSGTGSFSADFSSYHYKYFKIVNGANNSCWSKIEITYGEDNPSSAATFAVASPSIDLATTTQFTQTVSTAAGYTGTVTYAITDNTAEATINATTGTVNVTHEGSVTVKATAAAVENEFQESSASYTLTVTDSRASAPISFPVTTAEAIMGETFTAPVLTNSESLTVTYYSSNESVATVNETTGAVTLVAPGTTNIIATFAGNTTYKYTTAQYTLTVNKGAQSLPYEESLAGSFGEFVYDGVQADGVDVWSIKPGFVQATSYQSRFNEAESWLTSPVINAKNATHIALSFEHAINADFGVIADEAMVYVKKVGDADWTKLSITYPATPKSGYSAFWSTIVDLSAFAGHNIQIAFVYKGTETNNGTWRIKNVKVAVSAEDVTVTDLGLRTFVSDNALDFTDVDNLEAYIAKEEDGKVKLQQVRKVPAATGVLLRAKNGATSFTVPFATTAADDVSGNIFHRGTGAAIETGSGPYNWILSTKGGVAGFYHANGNTVATNHAYLQTSTANARIDLTFGEETGIENVKRQTPEEDGEVYDLQGRRVVQPTRGLYIVNGEKAIIK